LIPNWPLAEVLRDFIEFTNAQKGAYSDACAGFGNNAVSVGQQVALASRPTGMRVDREGVPTVMRTAVEDPTQPNVIVHTIRLATEFLEANGPEGRNEQQVCRAIVVFVFAYWDEETRPRCARLLSVPVQSLEMPVAGDLRRLRHAILHNKGVLGVNEHGKLEVLADLFRPGTELRFNHATMTEMFKQIDKGFAVFVGRVLDLPEPPGGWANIAQITIPQPPPGAR